MSRQRAKRPVRNPFVVTLAAATALLTPGCGARVDGAPTGDTKKEQSSECPAAEPTHLAPCSGDLSCNYGDCGGSATTTAHCESGHWQVMRSSCNPPPPDWCPPSAPASGSSCFSEGQWCEYMDRCVPSGQVSFTCKSGRWQGSFMTPTAACPTTPPVDGTSCAECAGRYPETCVYEYCGTYPSREAICNPVTKTWSTRWSSCNPPPPDVDAGTPEPDPAP